MEFYSILKKNAVVKFVEKKKKDGTGKYSLELTQALKHKCYMFFVMCRSQLLFCICMGVHGCTCVRD